MIGTSLSHYKILSELGRGGMGIVFKALDTKLDRTVAIKVLPAAALSSEDDRARFYREAKAAAQLHHPHIAGVFEIDEAVPEGSKDDDLRPFIAMEFVEGETLQEYIKKGPLKLNEAVNLAAQVADALKAAHAKDIVHRDIKSANVMLTPEGIAKVLDFGLAKTNQSTMLTQMGSTLGTINYMSPEQARGQDVDGRTDLYSLGTMLYEMIAGKLPFSGEYEQAVVYSILNEHPEPLTSLRTGVPMQLEWIVNKLLSKEAEYRYQTAADLLADLKTVDLSGSGQSRRSMQAVSAAGMAATAPSATRVPVWVIPAIVGALAVGALGVWLATPKPVVQRPAPVSFSIDNSADVRITNTRSHSLAISPDGSLIAGIHDTGILLRHSDNIEQVSLLDDTVPSAELGFSPDGNWIVYFDFTSGWLMKVGVSGGSPRRIVELNQLGRHTSHWGLDGYIYLSFVDSGIARVPENGGTLDYLLQPDALSDSVQYGSVFRLPDEHSLLYTTRAAPDVEWDDAEIWLLNLETSESTRLLTGGKDPRYLPTGHILYFSRNTLFAAPFDLRSGRTVGDIFPVMDDVWEASNDSFVAQFAVSDNGTLVKLRGRATATAAGGDKLNWVKPDGTVELLNSDIRYYWSVSISPDGEHILAWQNSGSVNGTPSIWLIDAVLGTSRLLADDAFGPVWSPDSDRFAYSTGSTVLAGYVSDRQKVDTLKTADSMLEPTDWSADGRYILLNSDALGGPIARQRARTDIVYLDLETGELNDFLKMDDDVDYGKLSPDGEWIAYELGGGPNVQVFAQRFPGGGNRFVVAGAHSERPVWKKDGKAIYVVRDRPAGNAVGGSLVEVAVDLASGTAGATRGLTTPPLHTTTYFDTHPDGRILLPTDAAESTAGTTAAQDPASSRYPPFDVVVNWFSTFPEKGQ